MKTGTKIVKAEYAGDYKIKITFSDKHVNTFDYGKMVKFNHEEFKPYLDITKFKKFEIVLGGNSIAWGKDHDMLISLYCLYNEKSFNPVGTFATIPA